MTLVDSLRAFIGMQKELGQLRVVCHLVPCDHMVLMEFLSLSLSEGCKKPD